MYYCDSLAHTNTVRLDRPLVDTAEYDWPDFGYLDIDSKVEIAAVVTPPDIMSQLFLAVPLCLLYEVGLLLAPLFERATRAPEDTSDTV